MRKHTLLMFFLLIVSIFFLSCSKKDASDNTVMSVPDETIRVKIAPNQSYQLDLSNAGTVSISRQAIHFSVSETMVNNENGIPFYKYIPVTDFTGNDEVVLLSTKTEANNPSGNSAGCPGSSNTNNTSIGTR